MCKGSDMLDRHGLRPNGVSKHFSRGTKNVYKETSIFVRFFQDIGCKCLQSQSLSSFEPLSVLDCNTGYTNFWIFLIY